MIINKFSTLLPTMHYTRGPNTKIDYYFAQEKLPSKEISTKFVSSNDQLANIFIKSFRRSLLRSGFKPYSSSQNRVVRSDLFSLIYYELISSLVNAKFSTHSPTLRHVHLVLQTIFVGSLIEVR